MRLLIFLWLTLLFLHGAQLHTRYHPLPCVVRRWRKVMIWPGLVVRVEVVRMR